MSANILNGKEVATKLYEQLKSRIETHIAARQRAPVLAVILVGQDPASEIYVRNKRQACQRVGITSLAYDLSAATTEEQLLALIDELNTRADIHGILVQLPLPSHINTDTILDKIRPDKDVDGFHPYNLGRLAQRRPTLRPCTPYGIIHLLNYYDIKLSGLDAVVIGASTIVGRPMSLELLLAKSTVTTCHSGTLDLAKHVSRADLLVVATGKPDLINSEWIKPGAIVVDVGIHRLSDGSIRGDIDFITAKERARWITPVPGGVGPMTIATLLQNTLYAAENLHASIS